ncbi:MAG TPA: helix-turn-helix domain-containing protein [Gemmatimonadaceae bacterium]|nr:helix-turn-helix domain-containing protein [Gemmatimonadaceae bacterium]
MGLVATLLPSQLRLNRARASLRDRYQVVTCDEWEQLAQVCANQPVSIAIVDLFPGGTQTTDTFDWVRQIKRRFPSVTVVLYASLPPARPRDLFEAGRFGLDGLIIADQDDEPRRLLAIIEQAEARGVLELLKPALADVKPTVRDALLVAVTRAHQRLSPEALARILGLRRKVLSDRLVQAGFPTAQRLLAWGRLVIAAKMLEDNERTADSVALALDFPSGSAFRNTCQRYLHAAPHQIRARGGAAYVISALLRQVQTAAGRRPTAPRAPAHAPRLAV